MIRFEWSEALGRKTRQDDPSDLAIPTWDLVRDAIKAGKTEEALELMDYEVSLHRLFVRNATLRADWHLAHLARFGEDEVEKAHRQRYTEWARETLKTPSAEELLQRYAEAFRYLHSSITITEEPDRYVVKLDPCGSGGLYRRTHTVAGTREAHPWSWGKSGVCYYCTHCCLFQEIIPIEIRGYPMCVTEYQENPENPCVQYYYKSPTLIPDEYFVRVGKEPFNAFGNVFRFK